MIVTDEMREEWRNEEFEKLKAERDRLRFRIGRLREYLSLFCSCEDPEAAKDREPGEKCGPCLALHLDDFQARPEKMQKPEEQ